MTKRSPSHPSISLPEALERAQDFFNAWGKDGTSIEELLKEWGYTPRSAAGHRLVASMVKFGLLEKTGRNGSGQRLRIQENVPARLLDTGADTDECSGMITQMALKPDIYRRLWNRWGSDLPEARSFRQFLVEEFDFNPRATRRFARCYIDTIGLARQHGLGRERGENTVLLEFEDDELLDID